MTAAGPAGLTPLHQAVLEGNLQAVKLLVMHGADVNKTDSDTWTPLHAACAEGHSEIVRYVWLGQRRPWSSASDKTEALALPFLGGGLGYGYLVLSPKRLHILKMYMSSKVSAYHKRDRDRQTETERDRDRESYIRTMGLKKRFLKRERFSKLILKK